MIYSILARYVEMLRSFADYFGKNPKPGMHLFYYIIIWTLSEVWLRHFYFSLIHILLISLQIFITIDRFLTYFIT